MNMLVPIAGLIGHFLGDFVFQSSSIARKKRSSPKHFIMHCTIYSIFMILSLMWFGQIRNTIIAIFVISISHAGVDYIRNKITNRSIGKKGDHKNKDFVLFIIDQLIHIAIIFATIHMLKGTNSLGKIFEDILKLHISDKQIYNAIIFILLYLICLSPTAVFIKKVFILFSFQNEDEIKQKDDLIKSGYLIGVLERIIILTLGLNGQLGAIGFVLAAKSLARFNQLNDKSFAEKYLVGTLMSTAISLFCIVIGNSLLRG